MDTIERTLLEQVAELHEVPEGAYNIRANGQSAGRNTTANIDIVNKTDKPGIDILIKPGTKNESVHIPVLISQTGLKEVVYNDFYIGDDCDVTIVAGCGIHNCGDQTSQHDGLHRFFVGKNAKVKYVERHYADGDGKGERVMNPESVVQGCGLHRPQDQCQAGRQGHPDRSGKDHDPRHPVCQDRLYRGSGR